MRCISIKQPRAWFILHAGADIENRPWTTDYRGPILIHASPRLRRAEYAEDIWRARRFCGVTIDIPSFEDIQQESGGIVGMATLERITVDKQFSRWFTGPFGFVLRNPVAVEFQRFKARIGIFETKFTEANFLHLQKQND